MANTKLSALAALAVEMANTDEIYLNDGGVSKRQLYSVFKAAFALAGGAHHDGFSDFVANEHVDFTAGSPATPFQSTGIDDNATVMTFQITSDILLRFGQSGAHVTIARTGAESSLEIAGGTSAGAGGNIVFYGQSHATLALDIALRGASTNQLYYDDSASTWSFSANTVKWAMGAADLPFFNFVADADADATSAVSTLTTSGTTTHHVQVDINGVKAWIAVSTNNPS